MPIVIRLMGQFRITGANREDLTPVGAKETGLLALLAVSNGQICTRSWLRSKLWSDRACKQSQDSLRQAIASLKKQLGSHSDLMIVTREGLSLDRERVKIDIFDEVESKHSLSEETFLADHRIRDKEFINWVASRREEFPDHSPRPAKLDATTVIGILPLVAIGDDATIAGNNLLARLAMSLSCLGPFSICDYAGVAEFNEQTRTEPDVMLLARCYYYDDSFTITLMLTCVSSNKLLWSTVKSISRKDNIRKNIFFLITQSTDQIANALSNNFLSGSAEQHQAKKLVIGSIDKIFSTSATDLDEAENALCKAIEIEPKGIYYGWYAYLMAFRCEELKEEYAEELKSKTHHLSQQALKLDNNNPLTLSLLAHAYSFIFRDFNRAASLIEPAIKMNSDLILVQDSYALLNFYTEKYEQARAAALQVLENSVFNPYRFCFATSLCMIDTVMGNYEKAAEYGELAIALHRPNQKIFAPTLRYLAVALEHTGKREEASNVFRILKEQEPTFRSSEVLRDAYPVPSKAAGTLLSNSLSKLEHSIH